MYPFIRMAKSMFLSRSEPRLPMLGEHVSQHICWPWDLDIWNELNNGRTLTLYDLGRIPLAQRTGMIGALRENRWGLTMAGAIVRYRRRVRAFDKITMRSRAVCWDDRFVYLEQSMWRKDGECANHAVYRAAVTSRNGIVAPGNVARSVGHEGPSPAMPDWLVSWCEAEAARPWPPMQD